MKILCFGDSNTYGYDPRSFWGDRYGREDRWVDLLAEKLGCEAVNAGENGRQIPYRDRQLQAAGALLNREKPLDLLVILLGTNDLLQGELPETAAARMAVFLESLDIDPGRILLIAPPPMQLGQWVPSLELVDASAGLSRQYEALARRLGVVFADAGMWDIPLTFDGVHFTEEGHRAFAEALLPIMTKEIALCWKSE